MLDWQEKTTSSLCTESSSVLTHCPSLSETCNSPQLSVAGLPLHQSLAGIQLLLSKELGRIAVSWLF